MYVYFGDLPWDLTLNQADLFNYQTKLLSPTDITAFPGVTSESQHTGPWSRQTECAIKVALLSVILLGLSINGYIPKLNNMSTNYIVLFLFLYFRRSIYIYIYVNSTTYRLVKDNVHAMRTSIMIYHL